MVYWNDTAFVKRRREFDSHSVLLIFDNLVDRNKSRLWCSGNPSACHADNVSSILTRRFAGWSSRSARQVHTLEVDGSNPSPAINETQGVGKSGQDFSEEGACFGSASQQH